MENEEKIEFANKYNELKERSSKLSKQNKELKEKLHLYENRKLGKMLMKLYTYSNRFWIYKFAIQVIYLICYIPLRLLGLLFRDSNPAAAKLKFKDVQDLKRIVRDSPSKNVVFFISPIEWDMVLKQRPQHIAKYMAKKGTLYFYIEQQNATGKIKEESNNLYNISCSAENFDFILEVVKENANKTFFCQLYSAEWTDTTSLLTKLRDNGVKIIYEYVDELSEEISGCELPQYLIKRFESAVQDEENTFIVATASKLYEDISFYRKKNYALIPNGVEVEHFSQKYTTKDLPFQMLKIFQQNRPIIGYYGAIATWMDFDLIKSVAKSKPDCNIVLIGLDYDGSLAKSGLSEFKNIYVIPPVKYDDLPRYANFFDICMIPFKINEVTKSTSPIKLFEYMALSKPIITTDMPECRKYKSVMIAQNDKEFVKLIDKGLKLRTDKEYMRLLHKEAEANTWDTRAQDTIELISN